jgi:hypothetical protein
LNTFYEKVISRFDLELAKTYFDEKNPLYKFRKPGETDFPKVGHFDDARYKPMFDIVHRAAVSFASLLPWDASLITGIELSFIFRHNIRKAITVEDHSG